MLTIACVCVGDAYGDEYVIRLRDGVKRWLEAPHRFVCFSDRHIDGVECSRVPGQFTGWWSKMWLFSGEGINVQSRVLFFDLDTIICGPLDEIADYDGSFAALQDFYRPRGLGSGVLMWQAGEDNDILDDWLSFGAPRFAGGDQAWIELARPDADRLQTLFPGKFVSFKADCAAGLPKGASVLCFHGQPKPHNCGGWAQEIWSGELVAA